MNSLLWFFCVFFFSNWKYFAVLLFDKSLFWFVRIPRLHKFVFNCKNDIKVSIPLDPSRVGFLPEDLAFRPVFLFVWLFFKQPLLNIIASIQTSQIYRSVQFVCCAFLFYLVLLYFGYWKILGVIILRCVFADDIIMVRALFLL